MLQINYCLFIRGTLAKFFTKRILRGFTCLFLIMFERMVNIEIIDTLVKQEAWSGGKMDNILLACKLITQDIFILLAKTIIHIGLAINLSIKIVNIRCWFAHF